MWKLEASGFGTFVQTTASAAWQINHDLNDDHPTVDVVIDYNGGREKMLPASIEHVSANSLIIRFSAPRTGSAVLAGRHIFKLNTSAVIFASANSVAAGSGFGESFVTSPGSGIVIGWHDPAFPTGDSNGNLIGNFNPENSGRMRAGNAQPISSSNPGEMFAGVTESIFPTFSGVVSWSVNWTPGVLGVPTPQIATYPQYPGLVIVSVEGLGSGTLSATIDGVPAGNTLDFSVDTSTTLPISYGPSGSVPLPDPAPDSTPSVPTVAWAKRNSDVYGYYVGGGGSIPNSNGSLIYMTGKVLGVAEDAPTVWTLDWVPSTSDTELPEFSQDGTNVQVQPYPYFGVVLVKGTLSTEAPYDFYQGSGTITAVVNGVPAAGTLSFEIEGDSITWSSTS